MRRSRILLLLLGLPLAAGLTWICIRTGADWAVAQFFGQRPALVATGVPGVILGMGVPPVLLLLLYRRYARSRQMVDALRLRQVGRAMGTAILLSSLLKAITCRVDMEPFTPLGPVDFSSNFRWGWMQGNDLWESLSEGWPSGHTFVASAALVTCWPYLSARQNALHLAYLLLIMLSVVTAFHWLSDVLSGLLLGILTGLLFVKPQPSR